MNDTAATRPFNDYIDAAGRSEVFPIIVYRVFCRFLTFRKSVWGIKCFRYSKYEPIKGKRFTQLGCCSGNKLDREMVFRRFRVCWNSKRSFSDGKCSNENTQTHHNWNSIWPYSRDGIRSVVRIPVLGSYSWFRKTILSTTFPQRRAKVESVAYLSILNLILGFGNTFDPKIFFES